MEPVRRSSPSVPLDRADVDTDQIIPSDWLSGSSAPASARGCSEWRESSDSRANPEHLTGADPGDGAQLRDRLVTGARRGAEDYGFRRDLVPLRRHLPQQLPQDRCSRHAACRRRDPDHAHDRGRPGGRDRHRRRRPPRRRPSTSTSRSNSRTSTTTACSRASTTSASPQHDRHHRLRAHPFPLPPSPRLTPSHHQVREFRVGGGGRGGGWRRACRSSPSGTGRGRARAGSSRSRRARVLRSSTTPW